MATAPPVLVATVPETVVPVPLADGTPTPSALRAFLATYQGGDCFAASVSGAEDTPTLAAYAADFVDSVALQLALGEAFTEQVDVDGYQISSAQCKAVAFVSGLQRAAAASMDLQLDAARIADGDSLTGTLDVPAGQAVHLLIVDDEGVVSDAGSYMTGQGGATVFSVPVHLTSEAESRIQLVIALASDAALDTGPVQGETADQLLSVLSPQLSDARVSIAIEPFVVR